MLSFLTRKQRARLLTKVFNLKSVSFVKLIAIATLFIVIALNIKDETFSFQNVRSSSSVDPSTIDDKCKSLPSLQPSGTFFLNGNVKNVLSADGIEPQFKLGSTLGDTVRYHMSTDTVHFKLIKEYLHGRRGGLTFDMGANQGFFTYYLAALGMDVHSFEISEKNFVSLQHGRHFNPKQVADHVNLYPMGLDNKVSRFSLSGHDYGGFLKDSDEGPILGVTFDCFAYHKKLDLSDVAFVKLDVEGFEIAVLQGASKSLFTKNNKIGSMLMEVGPARWDRAQIDFSTGVKEMEKLSTNFKNSYLLIRTKGGHSETCPVSLSKAILSDKKPRVIDDSVHIHKVKSSEWRDLIAEMKKHDYDCNFWYTN